MPQKNNLDICELIRAKSSSVKSNELTIYEIVKSSHQATIEIFKRQNNHLLKEY